MSNFGYPFQVLLFPNSATEFGCNAISIQMPEWATVRIHCIECDSEENGTDLWCVILVFSDDGE
jgi:formate dehydrogenase maturation protein FdhE